MPTRKQIFQIVSLFYIIYTVFPLLSDVAHIPVWLPSIFTFLVIFVLYPRAFLNNMVYWFVAYAGILAIYCLWGHPLAVGIGSVADSKKLLIEYAYILPAISIFSALLYLNDFKLTRSLTYLSLAFLYASFIIVIPLLNQYGSLREALGEVEDFYVPGLPGYSLMHAYALLLPSLCYATKYMKEKRKILYFVLLVGLCIVVVDTYVTTSLVVMILVLGLSIVYSEKHRSVLGIILALLFVFIYVFIQSGLLSLLLEFIAPFFRGTAVESKVVDLQSTLSGSQIGRSDMQLRIQLHLQSLNSFFANPLFGRPDIGNHSALLDRLGGMGLVATIPFVMILVSFYTYARRLFRTPPAIFFFYLGVLIGLMYLYEKDIWGCESWLFYMVLMPMSLTVFENTVRPSDTLGITNNLLIKE